MRIDNGVYRSIKVDWSDITLPLKAGTPMALDGTISNDADAIGLVPQDVIEATVQLPEYIYILVGGEVYLPEVEALSGLELDDAALSAMGGIRFYLDDIHVYGGNGGGSGSGLFIFHSTVDGSTQKLDKTWNEIKDAVESNLLPIELWINEDEGIGTTSWGYYYVEFIQSNPSGYTVNVNVEGDLVTYFTDDPDGLPAYTEA